MMTLNYILRKYTSEYKLIKSQEKDQSPNVHWRYQTVCQKWKTIGNPYISSENTYSGHRNGIWHRKMHHANNNKRERTFFGGGNRTTKTRKIWTLREKEIDRYLGILEADTIKQVEMKEKKIKKRISGEWENNSKQNYIVGTSSKGKIPGVYLVQFLKWIREKLKHIDQNTKKLMTMHKA